MSLKLIHSDLSLVFTRWCIFSQQPHPFSLFLLRGQTSPQLSYTLLKWWSLPSLVTTMTPLCGFCSINSSFFSNGWQELCSMQLNLTLSCWKYFPWDTPGLSLLSLLLNHFCGSCSAFIWLLHASLSSPKLFPADELPAYNRNPSYYSLSPCYNKVFRFLIPI